MLKSIPVIAITAFAMKGDEERIREGGCEAYLSKPISVAKFIATVKTYLEADRLPEREAKELSLAFARENAPDQAVPCVTC